MKILEPSRGIMVTSIDLELAWGTFRKEWYRIHEDVLLRGRELVEDLLQLFERHTIPATWAIVGHLFLESCSRQGAVAHPEIPRTTPAWLRGKDWFSHDPCTDRSRAPLWYGPDLIEKILRCPVPQEIASHSFSHVDFTEDSCRPEVVRAELAACLEEAGRHGVTVRSFVFPQDHSGHLDLLREAGFAVYRGPTASLFQQVHPRWVGRLMHFLDDLFAWPAGDVWPREALPGLWELPGSMMYGFTFGVRRWIPIRARVRKAKQGIERAIRDRKIFHFWFHPETLGYQDRELFEGFEDIYAYADRRRREGALEIVTMQEAVARCTGSRRESGLEC